MHSGSERRRVLAAVLVYDGREFVPRCLESVRRLSKGSSEVDILVFDDCSPDPGWSDELAELCCEMGISYYRSPRNLGIPRNMNLAFLRAQERGYDYVLILNSDVVVPDSLVDTLAEVVEANERVASVTPLSNNASIYSLPNDDAKLWLTEQESVEWLSEVLGRRFQDRAVEIPVGVGFCLLVPTAVAREVGLFDPVYGRGYCEENDWCLRAKTVGFANVLAPGSFVYHAGGESTRRAGLVRPGETTVVANERILDSRYPSYRADLCDFERSGLMDRLKQEAVSAIVTESALSVGYTLRVSAVSISRADQVAFLVAPDGDGRRVTAGYHGFTAEFAIDPNWGLIEGLKALIGRYPSQVTVTSNGPQANAVTRDAEERALALSHQVPYPEQV